MDDSPVATPAPRRSQRERKPVTPFSTGIIVQNTFLRWLIACPGTVKRKRKFADIDAGDHAQNIEVQDEQQVQSGSAPEDNSAGQKALKQRQKRVNGLLPSAEFAYNNQAHEGIKESPFYLEYGRHPRAGPILVKESLQKDLNDLTYKRHEALEQAKAALTLAAERMKWYYDKKVQSVPFKVGDKVLLNLKDYQTTEQALRPRYEGLFEIIEKLFLVTFRLRMPPRY